MAKIKSFVLHDESVNTRGFRMLTPGGDLSEFRTNPVMLLMHGDWSLPIGRWENIRIEGGKIIADPVFDMADLRGMEVAGKVERDFVRMASIGAWPLELSDDPALKLPGQTGPTITKWKAREASIVTIGSNHNAVAFYDEGGKIIDLSDPAALIKLMDTKKGIKPNTQNMDPELLRLLKLADGASKEEVLAAMNLALSDHARLKSENEALIGRIDALNTAAKAKQKADAIELIDTAIKDGRINATAKDSYTKLFDTDFESAKTAIESIPPRQSITEAIGKTHETNNVELADFQKKSWEEIDKANKLVVLKDSYPDLYKEKFKARFGIEPK